MFSSKTLSQADELFLIVAFRWARCENEGTTRCGGSAPMDGAWGHCGGQKLVKLSPEWREEC